VSATQRICSATFCSEITGEEGIGLGQNWL
jgi:hypothetical protein